jgi:hypothetical protein
LRLFDAQHVLADPDLVAGIDAPFATVAKRARVDGHAPPCRDRAADSAVAARDGCVRAK